MKPGLALVAVLLVAGPARAQNDAPSPVVGIVGRALDDVALVGPTGQVFHRADGVWRRSVGGGVAEPLTAAGGHDLTSAWAVAGASPVYLHRAGGWVAEHLPVRATPVVMTVDGQVILAGGRLLVRQDDRFRTLARAGKVCDQVARAGDRIAALCQDELRVFAGNRWTTVPSNRPVRLVGGDRLRLVDRAGAVFEIAPRKLVRMSGVAGLVARLGTPDPAGGALYAGTKDGRWVLVGERAGRLASVAELPAGHEPTHLWSARGAIVIVTRKGQVLVREAPGAPWKTEAIAPELAPPPAPPPPNPPARAG